MYMDLLDVAFERMDADATLGTYRLDPAAWAKDILGIHLWSKQREICESVLHNKRTVVASAHSTGKSLVSSVLACWWVAVHPPGSAIVVSTAPTFRQIHAILWEEMRKHHRSASDKGTPLPGKIIDADVWKLPDGRIVGMGRKPKDGDQHAFHGIHRRYVLVVIDEAAGVGEELWTGVEAITTTASCRILAIGNPDDRQTVFGDVFEEERYAPLWNRIRIPASCTPNFTGELVPGELKDVLVQPGWADDRRRAWGEEDARYQSKVEAKFPTDDQFGLFGAPLIARAVIDEDEHGRIPMNGPLVLGVDVARFGDDRSVVVARRGRRVWVVNAWQGMDTVATAVNVLEIARDLVHRDEDGVPDEMVEIRVDAVGVGAGVVDHLSSRMMSWPAENRGEAAWFRVREMIGSARVPTEHGGATGGYGNARAWWYDQLKHQMANGTVRLVAHERLQDELRLIRFRYSSGKMYIESKEELRRANRRSPDFADAVVYASAPVFEGLERGDVVSVSAQDAVSAMVAQQMEEMEFQMGTQISPF